MISRVERRENKTMKTLRFRTAIVLILFAMGAVPASTQQLPVPNDSAVDPGHTRYSPLTQINAKNVSDLKPIWVYDTGSTGRSWEGTAIVVNDVMYLSITGAAVALDPETGKQLWKFAPADLVRPGRDRGVAYWPGEGLIGPRIIYTITDRLYALDAKTGVPILDFGNNGMVNLRDGVADKYPNALYTMSSPKPLFTRIWRSSLRTTQEFGSKGPERRPLVLSDISNRQTRSGGFILYHSPGEAGDGIVGTLAGDGKNGPDSSAWGGNQCQDLSTGLAFVPIGNPDDSYNGIDRPGNNYYANSVIALDASTGKLKWFYQMTHHDITDFDAAAAPRFLST